MTIFVDMSLYIIYTTLRWHIYVFPYGLADGPSGCGAGSRAAIFVGLLAPSSVAGGIWLVLASELPICDGRQANA